MNTHSFYSFVTIVIFHILFFIVTVFGGNIFIGDSQEYLSAANNLINNRTLYSYSFNESIDMIYYSLNTPVYPLFIIFCSFISKSLYFLIFFQNLLCCLSWYFVIKILNHFKISRFGTLILSLSFLFYPNYFINVNVVAPDALFFCLLVFCFFLFFKFFVSNKIIYLVYSQISLAIAVLAKPILLFFPFLYIFFILYFYNKKSNFKYIVSTTIIVPTTILLWSYRNFIVTGDYHFSSIIPFNLVEYNTNYTLKRFLSESKSDSITSQIMTQAKHIKPFSKSLEFMNDKSLEILWEYPSEHLFCHIRGTILFLFLDPGFTDANLFYKTNYEYINFRLAIEYKGFKGLIYYFKILSWERKVLFSIVIIFAFFLNIMSILAFYIYRNNLFISFLFLFYIYFFIVTGVVGCIRYRIYIYPIFIFLFILILEHFIISKRT